MPKNQAITNDSKQNLLENLQFFIPKEESAFVKYWQRLSAKDGLERVMLLAALDRMVIGIRNFDPNVDFATLLPLVQKYRHDFGKSKVEEMFWKVFDDFLSSEINTEEHEQFIKNNAGELINEYIKVRSHAALEKLDSSEFNELLNDDSKKMLKELGAKYLTCSTPKAISHSFDNSRRSSQTSKERSKDSEHKQSHTPSFKPR